VIGILFGAGSGEPTTFTDSKHDGITNPAPINGNDAMAHYADDDGGYLRMVGSRYYRTGVFALDPEAVPSR
jgi:hypothetical protein